MDGNKFSQLAQLSRLYGYTSWNTGKYSEQYENTETNYEVHYLITVRAIYKSTADIQHVINVCEDNTITVISAYAK